MITVSKAVLFLGVIMILQPCTLSATDFNYDIDVDTATYKVKAFQTTITSTADELYGTIVNTHQSALYKVAIIDFGIANASGLSYDLIIDSIYIRTYKTTHMGYELVGQADMLRFNGVTISAKEYASFRVTLDYPHTDNFSSQYRVKIRIFGDYE